MSWGDRRDHNKMQRVPPHHHVVCWCGVKERSSNSVGEKHKFSKTLSGRAHAKKGGEAMVGGNFYILDKEQEEEETFRGIMKNVCEE